MCGKLDTNKSSNMSTDDLMTMTTAFTRDKSYFDSCQGRDPQDAVVVNLSQGVAGHIGESDFVFDVSIDGGKKMRIKRESGLLSEDIKYCPKDKGTNINVNVQPLTTNGGSAQSKQGPGTAATVSGKR